MTLRDMIKPGDRVSIRHSATRTEEFRAERVVSSKGIEAVRLVAVKRKAKRAR